MANVKWSITPPFSPTPRMFRGYSGFLRRPNSRSSPRHLTKLAFQWSKWHRYESLQPSHSCTPCCREEMPIGHSEYKLPLFVERVIRVRHEECKWISKRCRCLLERQAVLSRVGLRLFRVPLEYILQSNASQQLIYWSSKANSCSVRLGQNRSWPA